MKMHIQDGRRDKAGGKWALVIAFVFLAIASVAQDCTIKVYLESQTVKSGEDITIVGSEIISQPGKQFVVEMGGRAALQSAKRIELNYGFKALAGSVLFAGIVPCDPEDPEPEPSVVFPNPTDGVLNVKASYVISGLRVTDMSGQLQLEKPDINDVVASIDLSPLKPGLYILEIVAGRVVAESVRVERK